MWLILLVGLGILAYLIYISFRPRSQPRTEQGVRNDQLGVARDRLARGEITAEEFDQIKKRLE